MTMHPIDAPRTAQAEAAFAVRVRGALDLGAGEVRQEIAVRLQEARAAALQRQAAPAVSLLARLGARLSDIAAAFGAFWHRHSKGAMAFLVLLTLTTGIFSFSVWQSETQADALAALDSELLGDDVPPDAYTDTGFLKWLQDVSEEDDDLLG